MPGQGGGGGKKVVECIFELSALRRFRKAEARQKSGRWA